MKNDFSLFMEINLILIVFAAIFFQGASAEIDWYPIGMWIFAVFCLSFMGGVFRGYQERRIGFDQV